MVGRFLLDTNCISEAVRRRPEPHVISWLDSVAEEALFLSVLTLGEIRKGIVNTSGARQQYLTSWLENDLIQRFTGRVLSIDASVSDRWGELAGHAKRVGRPIGAVDALIAATAIVHGLVVATRNVDDFVGLDVDIFNPWTSSLRPGTRWEQTE